MLVDYYVTIMLHNNLNFKLYALCACDKVFNTY